MVRTSFSIWYSGNSQKIQTNQFLVSTIFFANINISFFSLCSDIFSIIAKKVSQIRNNVVCSWNCAVARFVFIFCCALTISCCNAFQHIFVNQKKSELYSPYFQTVLFLVIMFWGSISILNNLDWL